MSNVESREWELFSLMSEVRRRVRRLNGKLEQDPRWIAALPPQDAQIARAVLAATRARAVPAIKEAIARPRSRHRRAK